MSITLGIVFVYFVLKIIDPEMKLCSPFLFVLLFFCSYGCRDKMVKDHFKTVSDPSFQVDFAMPTADKPQSKLWFMNETWWALLPRSDGPSIWQRTNKGWKEYPEFVKSLKGIPGRADIWADKNEVIAVGVGNKSLSVFSILFKGSPTNLSAETKILAVLLPPHPDDTIETATIVKDGTGELWVAAVASSKVCVWNMSVKGQWTSPVILKEGIDPDDICVVTELPDGIGVVWSDQIHEAVLLRTHNNNEPADNWEDEVIIDEGNKTSDDHLNTSLSPDGTLWVATKNSLDSIGKPQFVMRVLPRNGIWKNIPYVILEEMKRPSRPIVIAAEDNSVILTGYGTNDRSVPFPYNSEIVFSIIDPAHEPNIGDPVTVISPDLKYNSFVQNVTGPKHPFPLGGPWIILASDQEGRVYEADLKKLVNK